MEPDDAGTRDDQLALRLGASVTCTDGAEAELSDVILDPRAQRVTHVVASPIEERHRGRMVPLAQVASRDDGAGLRLSCTGAELADLEPVTQFAVLEPGEVPTVGPGGDVGVQADYALPMGGEDMGGTMIGISGPAGVTFDRIPEGAAELRRSSSVTSADGHFVGHVDGVLVAADGRLTHLLLGRGHLWTRREAALPVAMVATWQTDAVDLRATKSDVDALPSVRLRRDGSTG